MSDVQTEPVVREAQVASPQRKSSWESIGPTWRWIAGGALTIVAALFTIWMNSMATSQSEIAAYSRQSAEAAVRALALQAERTASLESWRSSTDIRLGRIEAGQDRMEGKLDRALERK